MNLLSYDIEIYNELPQDQQIDFSTIIPSVGAIGTNEEDVKFYYDEPYMTVETSQRLVRDMLDYQDRGYLVWGWNIVSFDFRLLAHYSGMVEECAELALNGIDGMLLITFNKGYFLGLDTALIGAGLETKLHHVKLNDGTPLDDMSGAKAPELWRNGEFKAVMDYLYVDVVGPIKLAFAIEKNKGIKWHSKKGNPMFVETSLTQVKDLFKLPEPDVSWMSDPKPRKMFVDWIPENILHKYNIKV